MDDSGCGQAAERAPLPMLLSRVSDRFVGEFERRLGEAGFRSLSVAHSANVLRFLRDSPIRASQLVALSGVSKQAVSQQLAHLERNGYVTLEPDPCDQRARVVSLTALGCQAQRRIDALFGEVEQDWAKVLGDRDAASLRRVLEKAYDRLEVARCPGASGAAVPQQVLSRSAG